MVAKKNSPSDQDKDEHPPLQRRIDMRAFLGYGGRTVRHMFCRQTTDPVREPSLPER
jgi:hypothetical protein